MDIKEITYKKEDEFLSPYAKKSKDTLGRDKDEEPCPSRTDFQRDRDRIIYSRSFIRLKNKTQVFFSPEGDHFMTRLTHTLDVCQVARSISRSLLLNEDLAEAIALGHDIGHTPFGHAGERCLDKLSSHGFKHNEQSLRVVEKLENGLIGLNLTKEVRDGIVNHKMSCNPSTLEGKVVSISDRIAYLNHDVDDAIRAKVISIDDIPKDIIERIGKKSSERINTLISDVVNNSLYKPQVSMSKDLEEVVNRLRKFMFENVYLTPQAKLEEEKAYNMFEALFKYFKNNINKLPEKYLKIVEMEDSDLAITDYLSSMTDRYAISIFKSIFIPENFYY